MTIKEKRAAIENYCEAHKCSEQASSCIYAEAEDFFCARYSAVSAPNEVVNDWYALIAEEKVNHPSHYQGKHECIDEMIALFGVDAVIGFCKCNVHKYRYRAKAKNGQEDLDKADWYMDKLMELEAMKND